MNIAVLGIGNVLRRDDGLGVAAAKQLAAMRWPEHIRIYDAGTALMSLWDVFAENQVIIVIDALKGGNEPGTVYRFSADELGGGRRETLSSLHDLQVEDMIRMAALFNKHPRVIFFGMEPAALDMEPGLSERIQEKLPLLVECIRKELTLLC